MKKVFFSLAAASLFAFASCSTEKDCECQTIIDGEVTSTVTETVDFSESDDMSDCEDMNTSVEILDITTEVKCKEV